MSENKFIEDDLDRMQYYYVPTSTCAFEGLWCLSAFFSSWRKKRLAKKKEKQETKRQEKGNLQPEKSLETITI